MHQLVSSQVDVDRLDYLKRDSFYTGVTEGNINASRILAMMNVKEEQLVFEVKGIHSLEKFLLARRLMYWQVYLHKTSLAAEMLLVKTIERFQYLIQSGVLKLKDTPSLYPLLRKESEELNTEVLLHYLTLDDTDIIQLLKSWEKHSDTVLAQLSSQLLHRKLPKIKVREEAYTPEEIDKQTLRLNRPQEDSATNGYFVFSGSITNQTYLTDESQLLILDKKGSAFPLADAIPYLDFKQFSTPITKYYLCYPKQVNSP